MADTTKFEREMIKRLEEKGLSASSIKLYLRNLQKINNNENLTNLRFLKDTEKVLQFLEKYKQNTRRSFLIAITSVLQTDQNTNVKKKLYQTYYDLLKDKNKVLKEAEKENQASPQQATNWVDWEQVQQHHKDLAEKVASFATKKSITAEQYQTLLQYLILSLYTLVPTRRNLDYQRMVIQNKDDKSLPTDRNYILWADKQFLFNVFKTAKKEGAKREPIPESLYQVLDLYRRFHPYYQDHPPNKQTKGSISSVPLLVDYKGNPLNKVNSITRILNQIFKKRVGSSLLRHSYLTGRYGKVLQEMKEDASKMSHSLETQKNYIIEPAK